METHVLKKMFIGSIVFVAVVVLLILLVVFGGRKSTPDFDDVCGVLEEVMYTLDSQDDTELERLREAQETQYGISYKDSFRKGVYAKLYASSSYDTGAIEFASDADAKTFEAGVKSNTEYFVIRKGDIVIYSRYQVVIDCFADDVLRRHGIID